MTIAASPIGCWDWRDLMTLFGFLEVPEEDLIPNWINIELESQKKKQGGK